MTLSRMMNELQKRVDGPHRNDDGSWHATLIFDREFCGFDGHFEEAPLVPGVCQIAALELLAGMAMGCELTLTGISKMKFKTMLLPGACADYRYTITETDGKIAVSGTVAEGENKTAAQIKLELERK